MVLMLSLHKVYKESMEIQHKVIWPDENNGRKWPLTTKNSLYPHHADDEYRFSDFRWHDLRHTWASWHVQAGTPIHALQELGGWQSYEMVLRYAHLAPGHLAAYADRLSITAQFPAQSETGERERVLEQPLTT